LGTRANAPGWCADHDEREHAVPIAGYAFPLNVVRCCLLTARRHSGRIESELQGIFQRNKGGEGGHLANAADTPTHSTRTFVADSEEIIKQDASRSTGYEMSTVVLALL
jgi:hypothetical protein